MKFILIPLELEGSLLILNLHPATQFDKVEILIPPGSCFRFKYKNPISNSGVNLPYSR